jgi:hypothetical protein
MGERYYLGVYWGHRRETIDESAARALRILAGLREVEPELFPRWFVWKGTKEESLLHPLVEDVEHVRDQMRKRRNDPDHPPLPDVFESGYALDIWNGFEPDMTCRLALTIAVHHGAWNVPAPNDCEVMLPIQPRPGILDPARLANVLARLARDADADWGTVTTNNHLMASAGNREPGAPLIGWVVFLSQARGKARKALPKGASVETVEGLGSLYTASPAFDWGASDALRTALEKGKLVHPTGAKPAESSSAAEPGAIETEGVSHDAAVELSARALSLAEKARTRERAAAELAAAASTLLVKRDAEAASHVAARLDLAHRLGLLTDEDRESFRELLARLEAQRD